MPGGGGHALAARVPAARAVDGGVALRVRWTSVVSHGTPVLPWASGSMKPSRASATSGERMTTTKRTRALGGSGLLASSTRGVERGRCGAAAGNINGGCKPGTQYVRWQPAREHSQQRDARRDPRAGADEQERNAGGHAACELLEVWRRGQRARNTDLGQVRVAARAEAERHPRE